MQQEDDLRGLARVMDFMRAVSILFVGINVYWFCYSTLKEWGVTFEVIDKILWNFQRTTGLFSSVLWTKLFSVVFLALSCIGTKGVKEEKITWAKIHCSLAAGVVLFFLNWWLLELPLPHTADTVFYIATLSAGYICMLMAGTWMSRLLKNNLMDDVFNTENESFQQETRLIENEYSVNLPTRFYYKKKWNNGWINVVNPFRASLVLGTPGSGKSYAVVNSYIKQQIEKGFALYCYDYKFPDLSEIAYNHLLNHLDGYKVKPKFYIINFDDPRKSHRCNPINASFMSDIADAYEASYTIMLNLNRSWISKQGDFFVESPIILLAAIIWYLRIYQGGKYCTFPHAIELLNKKYADVFTILRSYPELENYLSPFVDAWESDAQEQLQGQIASAKIPLSRMISPALYWVMTGDDFSLDINNPKEPKIPSIKTQMHIIGAQDIDGVQTNYSLYSGILDDYHSNFIWDYRDDFSYCNFDDNTGHGTGDNKSAGNLLNQIWSNIGVATTTNTPFRYYDHKTGQIDKQNTKAAYIEPTSNGHQLIINPNVWQAADGKYPYGAMLGNMRFTLENKPENLEAGTLCASQYSFIIWFDETYEGN